MMFDVHPLHPSQPSPSQKLNRENRIKNACLSNSHSNIAASNDKRPLFVQILAIPSASLVSTSLSVQCLRPSNFFFCRGIFLNSFLYQQRQARAPAGRSSRASLLMLIYQQRQARAPARRSSCASLLMLIRQQRQARAPARRSSRASLLMLVREQRQARAPVR